MVSGLQIGPPENCSGRTIFWRRKMFNGSMPALVTPFTEKGAVDKKAFKELVEWQIEEGSNGLVPVGTTGESPTLSHDEHKEVVEICIETAKGRVPVMAGAGSNNTHEAIELAKHAEKAGADGILVVTPYYNKPTQRGLFEHFSQIAKAVKLPIFIYNIPPRSVIDMTPQTMGALAKAHKNIVGVKDATANIERVSLQRISCGKDFVQLSGEDATALGFNSQGGVGAISVTANVAPRLCAEFQSACTEGDYTKALELHDKLMPLHSAIFIEPGLAGVKYALSKLGKITNKVRSPLTTVEASTEKALDDAMRKVGLIN